MNHDKQELLTEGYESVLEPVVDLGEAVFERQDTVADTLSVLQGNIRTFI